MSADYTRPRDRAVRGSAFTINSPMERQNSIEDPAKEAEAVCPHRTQNSFLGGKFSGEWRIKKCLYCQLISRRQRYVEVPQEYDSDSSDSSESEAAPDPNTGLDNREAAGEGIIDTSKRVAAFWRTSKLQAPLSGEARHLIESSWSSGTEGSYGSNWRGWCRYARSRNIEELSPTLGEVIEFLTSLFNDGLKYNSINSYRSALSGTLVPIQGFKVGEHPMVSRLLKGVFNLRPPEKKLFPTWEVEKALEHIKGWGLPEELDLAQLTRKTIFLLALVSSKRVKALSNLSMGPGLIEFSSGSVRFRPVKKDKHHRPSFLMQPWRVQHFSSR